MFDSNILRPIKIDFHCSRYWGRHFRVLSRPERHFVQLPKNYSINLSLCGSRKRLRTVALLPVTCIFQRILYRQTAQTINFGQEYNIVQVQRLARKRPKVWRSLFPLVYVYYISFHLMGGNKKNVDLSL